MWPFTGTSPSLPVLWGQWPSKIKRQARPWLVPPPLSLYLSLYLFLSLTLTHDAIWVKPAISANGFNTHTHTHSFSLSHSLSPSLSLSLTLPLRVLLKWRSTLQKNFSRSTLRRLNCRQTVSPQSPHYHCGNNTLWLAYTVANSHCG